MFESVSGLPAHPLFIHAPVVLIPLTTILAIAMTVFPPLRRDWSGRLALAAALTLFCTQLAVTSGYAFDELVSDLVNTDEHERLGVLTRNLVALFFLAAATLAAVQRWLRTDRDRLGAAVTWALMILTAASAVAATVFAVRTGEAGARLVWDGVLTVF